MSIMQRSRLMRKLSPSSGFHIQSIKVSKGYLYPLPIPMRSDERERGGRGKEREEESEAASLPIPANCDRLFGALTECHHLSGNDTCRCRVQCRHLNRVLGECIVMALCGDEAVRSLCARAGTLLKRSQCRHAQINLLGCLSVHQR